MLSKTLKNFQFVYKGKDLIYLFVCDYILDLPNCEANWGVFGTVRKFSTMEGAHWWFHMIWIHNVKILNFKYFDFKNFQNLQKYKKINLHKFAP